MSQSESTAVICNLLNKLASSKSWCGETHVQKAAYFLQHLVGESISFRYQMYKHGPFSFELSGKLAEMRADSVIELVRQPYPYGPSMRVCDHGKRLISQFEDNIFDEEVNSVAQFINSRGVTELERLATALFVIQEYKSGDQEEIASIMLDLKPHLDRQAAIQSIVEVQRFLVSRESAH